jgi:ureidoacrylate peracid hydrolase
MELTTEDTALLVIDMQNTFCDDAGGCVRAGLPIASLQAVVEPCQRLIDAARTSGVPVIYTRYVCQPDYADAGVFLNQLNPRLKEVDGLAAGTADVEIISPLQPEEDDVIIVRNRPSAFYGANLDAELLSSEITRLVVCGVTTACCVESTVRDAATRDFLVFVVADAVAEFETADHRAALKSMGRLFASLTSVDEVASAWRREAA